MGKNLVSHFEARKQAGNLEMVKNRMDDQPQSLAFGHLEYNKLNHGKKFNFTF